MPIELPPKAKMKSYMAFLGSMMFFVVCVSLYLMMESVQLTRQGVSDFREIPNHRFTRLLSTTTYVPGLSKNDLDGIEVKIKQIETDLKRNHKTINMIKDTVREFANGDSSSLQKLKKALDAAEAQQQNSLQGVVEMRQSLGLNTSKLLPLSLAGDLCAFANNPPQKTDVQMLDVYESLSFDNVEGGVWKQGWPLTFDNKQYEAQKLKVVVVPHSHTDPGWLKTFERYYGDQTRHIFDNMLDKLEALPKMKFIYAEMSFFQMWWSEITNAKKDRVKKLLQDNRLEIVTGGWVMNDEANSHYFAMVDQMIEGNQWLNNHLSFKPKTGWAIDPFGHSPTMAYLLKKMGFTNMLIQRVHYETKKYLGRRKELEFMWRQNWDHTGSTDILCHMMPFYSYDVPHTCGPDPKVCCQFDFARLPGGRISCPWKVPPQEITDVNVQQRAEMLLDQFKKKSQLYKGNVVLVPLGDDFRYDKVTEWDAQYRNYQKLFDYMNSREDWHVEAQFGTLSDYFDALHERGHSEGGRPKGYPVLGGDFYTYADRDDHYWSGYYTSRPFYKRMDRVLEAHLRGAEIIFSLAVAHMRHHGNSNFPETRLMKYLVSARRNLGLFQHHDGITGTAKDFVVVDYGVKMMNSLVDLKQVTAESAHFLSLADKSKYSFSENDQFFNVDETIASQDAIPDKTIIELSSSPVPVVFYNSLAHTRKQVVRLFVSDPEVKVTDPKGNVVPSQVDPFWVTDDEVSTRQYKLMFIASVPALGLSKYTLQKASANQYNTFAKTTMYNSRSDSDASKGHFVIEKKHGSEEYSIENPEMKASFHSEKGMLQRVTLKASGSTVQTKMEFLRYGTVNKKDKSGAYLFLPDGPAQALYYSNPFIRVVRGPIMSEMTMFITQGSTIQHTVRLYNSPGTDSLSLDIQNIVDLRGETNKELVMRIQSDVKNNREFFTDLNGFQIQRRKTHDKLPLQANFYPMPTMAYIQDKSTRLSIFSGQSLGVASLFDGQIEIVQDRRLNQDDNRGLQQGVLDNKKTPNKFRIMLERPQINSRPAPSQPTGYPSLTAHLASQELIHPMVLLPPKGSTRTTPSQILHTFAPLAQDLPCQLHLLNLRTLQHGENNADLRFKPREEIALVLHRLGTDCSYPARVSTGSCSPTDSKVTLERLFQGLTISEVRPSSLSLIHDSDTQISPASPLEIPIMELEAFKIKLK